MPGLRQIRFNASSRPMQLTLTAVGLATILAILFSYYQTDYRYPTCCDTAITLMKAQQIAETGRLNPPQLYNPSYNQPLYGSIISTEVVTHLLLALIYWAVPATIGSLIFAKFFFLVLFLLAAFPLFWLVRVLTGKRWLALAGVSLVFFSFWYGNMYWTGHVAQMLGMFVLLLFISTLIRHERTGGWKWLALAAVLIGLSFFVHVLTFLIMFLVGFSYIFLYLIRQKRTQIWALAGYVIFVGLLFAYFKLLPASTHLLPFFAVNAATNDFRGTVAVTFMITPFLILFILGAASIFRQGQKVIILWFLVTYLLSQSSFIGTTFYPFRFTEFLVLPLVIVLLFGLQTFANLFHHGLLRTTVIVSLLAIFIVSSVAGQEQLKQCYIANCYGLHPTQIPEADLVAFRWIERYTPPKAVFAGLDKFGYYLPIMTGRPLELPEGEKRHIFEHPSAKVRWQLSQKYHIQYIFWDAITAQRISPNFPRATDVPFVKSRYFKMIYVNQGARIFQVQ